MRLVHNVKYLRDMIINEAKIYDREYVEKVLGIKIPLQETIFGYSSEFHARVLKEHMLYEGFIDTLKQAAGLVVNAAGQAAGAAGQTVTNAVQAGVQKVQEFTDKVKNLAKALYGVMTDSGLLGGYLGILKKNLFQMTKPLRSLFTSLDKLFSEEILTKFPNIKAAFDKIKPMYEKTKKIVWASLLNPVNKLSGWGGALAGSTIYVFLQWMRNKVGDMASFSNIAKEIETFISGNMKEALKDTVISDIEEILKNIGTKVVTKALNTVVGTALKGTYTTFAPWISAVGGIVGSVDWVATALAPITNTYAERVNAGQQPAPQPGKVDLRRTIAASGQKAQALREHSDIGTLLAYLK